MTSDLYSTQRKAIHPSAQMNSWQLLIMAHPTLLEPPFFLGVLDPEVWGLVISISPLLSVQVLV